MYRLDLSMVSSDPDIQNELFVIRRASPVEAYTVNGAARDEFWGVCRYVDISTLGVNEPNAQEYFYLTDTWTLVFGHDLTREESVTVLQADTTKLAKEISAYTDPDNSDIVIFEQDF
tara:strand:- start:356 stop:706 length:351 start_codon:yes stop_codon:yes gene_type:complete